MRLRLESLRCALIWPAHLRIPRGRVFCPAFRIRAAFQIESPAPGPRGRRRMKRIPCREKCRPVAVRLRKPRDFPASAFNPPPPWVVKSARMLRDGFAHLANRRAPVISRFCGERPDFVCFSAFLGRYGMGAVQFQAFRAGCVAIFPARAFGMSCLWIVLPDFLPLWRGLLHGGKIRRLGDETEWIF